MFYEHADCCDLQPVQRIFLGEDLSKLVPKAERHSPTKNPPIFVTVVCFFFVQNSMQSSLFRRRLGIRAAFEVLRRRKVSFKYRSNVDTIGWVYCKWNRVHYCVHFYPLYDHKMAPIPSKTG